MTALQAFVLAVVQGVTELFPISSLGHAVILPAIPLERLGWGPAVVIGFAQCLALIPGLSRSGATMAGGYLVGLDHEDAARFSFSTATPVILGAGVLEAPKLLHHGGGGFS